MTSGKKTDDAPRPSDEGGEDPWPRSEHADSPSGTQYGIPHSDDDAFGTYFGRGAFVSVDSAASDDDEERAAAQAEGSSAGDTRPTGRRVEGEAPGESVDDEPDEPAPRLPHTPAPSGGLGEPEEDILARLQEQYGHLDRGNGSTWVGRAVVGADSEESVEGGEEEGGDEAADFVPPVILPSAVVPPEVVPPAVVPPAVVPPEVVPPLAASPEEAPGRVPAVTRAEVMTSDSAMAPDGEVASEREAAPPVVVASLGSGGDAAATGRPKTMMMSGHALFEERIPTRVSAAVPGQRASVDTVEVPAIPPALPDRAGASFAPSQGRVILRWPSRFAVQRREGTEAPSSGLAPASTPVAASAPAAAPEAVSPPHAGVPTGDVVLSEHRAAEAAGALQGGGTLILAGGLRAAVEGALAADTPVKREGGTVVLGAGPFVADKEPAGERQGVPSEGHTGSDSFEVEHAKPAFGVESEGLSMDDFFSPEIAERRPPSESLFQGNSLEIDLAAIEGLTEDVPTPALKWDPPSVSGLYRLPEGEAEQAATTGSPGRARAAAGEPSGPTPAARRTGPRESVATGRQDAVAARRTGPRESVATGRQDAVAARRAQPGAEQGSSVAPVTGPQRAVRRRTTGSLAPPEPARGVGHWLGIALMVVLLVLGVGILAVWFGLLNPNDVPGLQSIAPLHRALTVLYGS